MGYKAAIQILKRAEDLKPKILEERDLLNDTEAWTNQQKLLNIYHQVLVLDLEYALDKKVEQDLWNIGIKNNITALQEKIRDKKNSQRSNYQALLTWALESASGYYLTLLQELCNAFDIDLPFRRRGIIYGQTISNTEQITVPQNASCSYICQYCLVHLGDIARYRNQRKQAESFYKQAILISPHSGQPYNQLALLEASQSDKLSTVFYYIRGICVKNPFPASTTNLMNVLSSAIDKESPLEKLQTKMSVNEYIQLFLCAHGHFHTLIDFKQAELVVQSLNSVMTALVATQSFKKHELIKITVINLYALTHLGKDAELTEDELKINNLILQLLAGSLNAFLMPVYTLQNEEVLLDYYALPAVKLLMYFFYNKPEILNCDAFKERMQIWPSLCKVVNAAQSLLVGFNYNKFSKCSLQEDRDLQGFIPLSSNFKELNSKTEIEDIEIENKVRMRRIINFAKWLSDFEGIKLITKTESKGIIHFEAVLSQPDPTNDLLEEMKSLTVSENLLEKKAGILKPQGSLEKSREEREVKKNNEVNHPPENVHHQKVTESVRTKRAKQNVVLQSIFKKMEENKQVKFNVDGEEDKEKNVKFDQPTKIAQQPLIKSAANQFPINQSSSATILRNNQNFNQPQGSYSVQSPQTLNLGAQQNSASTDYLTNLRNLGQNFSSNQPSQTQQFPSFPPPSFNVPPPQFMNSWGGRDDLNKTSVNNNAQQNPWWNQTYPQSNNQGFSNQFGGGHQQSSSRAENVPPPSLKTFQNHSTFMSSAAAAHHHQNPNYPSQIRPQQDIPNYNNMFPQFGMQYQGKSPNNVIATTTGGGSFDLYNNQNNWGGIHRGGGGNNINNVVVADDAGSTSMSMRQAMLKEATLPGQRQNIRMSPQTQDIPTQTPTGGYSLFNNNSSWAPSLSNQIRSDNNSRFNGPQHSLFGGPGPQSLAQLLEHQQNLITPNKSMINRGNQET